MLLSPVPEIQGRAEAGVSQLVIGTDHPIPWQDKSIDHVLNCPHFSDAEKRMMLGETAGKLLGIAPFSI